MTYAKASRELRRQLENHGFDMELIDRMDGAVSDLVGALEKIEHFGNRGDWHNDLARKTLAKHERDEPTSEPRGERNPPVNLR